MMMNLVWGWAACEMRGIGWTLRTWWWEVVTGIGIDIGMLETQL